MKSKSTLLFGVFIIWSAVVIAQTNTFPPLGAVGTGTTSPDISSLPEIRSTTIATRCFLQFSRLADSITAFINFSQPVSQSKFVADVMRQLRREKQGLL